MTTTPPIPAARSSRYAPNPSVTPGSGGGQFDELMAGLLAGEHTSDRPVEQAPPRRDAPGRPPERPLGVKRRARTSEKAARPERTKPSRRDEHATRAESSEAHESRSAEQALAAHMPADESGREAIDETAPASAQGSVLAPASSRAAEAPVTAGTSEQEQAVPIAVAAGSPTPPTVEPAPMTSTESTAASLGEATADLAAAASASSPVLVAEVVTATDPNTDPADAPAADTAATAGAETSGAPLVPGSETDPGAVSGEVQSASPAPSELASAPTGPEHSRAPRASADLAAPASSAPAESSAAPAKGPTPVAANATSSSGTPPVPTTSATVGATPAPTVAAARSAAPPERSASPEPPSDPWQQVLTVIRPLRRFGDGTERLSIRLSPEDLGTVNVELSLKHGQLSLHLLADSATARSALADSLHLLRAELESGGVRTGSLEVGHHQQRHTGETGDQRGPGGRTAAPGTTDLARSVIDLRTPSSQAAVIDGRLDVRI